jgi:hypothetical protein
MKYNIYLDGETQGPFTRTQLEAKNLPPDTPCAAENETAWDTVGAILERPEPLPLYTEGTAVGTLAGGVLAALWLGAAVFGGGLAKALLIVGCLGVLLLGVLAIVRIRNAPECNGTPFAAIGMTLALVTLMTGLIVKPGSGKSGSSGQAKNKKEDNGKGRSGGGFGFARAKMGANRIKCVNNLGQVYKAGLAFAQDNGERFPWQLTSSGVRNHFGSELGEEGTPGTPSYGMQISPDINEVVAHPNSLAAAGVYALPAMKVELVTPKILHSPCDPARSADNDIVQENWRSYNTRAQGVSAELGRGCSYVLVRGADTHRPFSVYAVTRNWSTDNLNTGKWLGSDSDPTSARTMDGLSASQGQCVMTDGSAKQSNNADFQANGSITKNARNSTGGCARGQTSLNLIRGPGL